MFIIFFLFPFPASFLSFLIDKTNHPPTISSSPNFHEHHDRNLQNFCQNVHNLVTVKLDNKNFDLWRKKITLSLTAYRLFSFVDGSSPPPTSTVVIDSPSPAATVDNETWVQTDALILSNILSIVSPSLLPKLSHHATAASTWSDLLTTYTTLSVAHIKNLKSRLLEVEKIGTMEDYLDQIKNLSDKLTLAGAPMSDLDLVHQTVFCLPDDYDPITTLVRNTYPHIVTFAGLYAMLNDEEIVLKNKNQ